MTDHVAPSSSHQAGPSTTGSIQFDEASLSRAHSRSSRKRVQSSAANSNVSSSGTAGGSTIGTAGAATSSRHKRNTPSTTSTIPSRHQPAPARTGDSSNRRKVVTRPAWAQLDDEEEVDEDEGPSQQPIASTSANNTLPKNWAPSGGAGNDVAAARTNSNTTSNSSGDRAAPAPQTHDDNDLKGPGRFWTFTLPTKYRNRLHEHHLRMLRNEMVERDSQQGRARRRSRSSERRRRRDSAGSSSSNGSSAASSSGDSDRSSGIIVQGLSGAIPNGAQQTAPNGGGGRSSKASPHTPRNQSSRTHAHSNHARRSSGGGLGDVLASAGAAAGLGGQDSLIGWRRRQQEQRQNSNGERLDVDGDAEKQQDRGDPSQQDASSPDQSSMDQQPPPHLAHDDEEQQRRANVAALPATEMRARIKLHSSSDASLTRHQQQTPGWESPWHPEEMTGLGAIDVGGYTFPTGGTGDGFFPRTDTRRSGASGGGQKRRRFGGGGTSLRAKSSRNSTQPPGRTRNGMTSLSEKGSHLNGNKNTANGADGWWASKWAWWKEFLMRNPFVPLLFRAINICFTTATLAVAIRLWRVLHVEGAADSVGSSPVVGIIFAPLSLVHVAAQVWLEYFSRPIGLWAVKSKLSYQLIEVSSGSESEVVADKTDDWQLTLFPPPVRSARVHRTMVSRTCPHIRQLRYLVPRMRDLVLPVDTRVLLCPYRMRRRERVQPTHRPFQAAVHLSPPGRPHRFDLYHSSRVCSRFQR